MIKISMKKLKRHYVDLKSLSCKFMIFLVVLVCSFFAVNPGRAIAQEDAEIKVYLNESKIVTVNKPKRIAIGNPDIMDVISASDDMVILSPKTRGVTNLMIWDNTGIHSYRVKIVGGDMQEVKLRVDEILDELHLTNVQSKVSEDDGRVFLFGDVRSAQDRDFLNLALGPLRPKVTNLIKIREEDMVEIEAQLVELSKDGTKSLGFSWPGSIAFSEQGSPGIQTTGAKPSALFKVLNYSRDQFNFTMDALIQENKARILSKPRLACLSGKEAQLLVGGEKPIFTTEVVTSGSTGLPSTSVTYKEYGIKLKIKPIVLENNMISLTLNLSISEPGAVESIGGASTTASAYPFTKRDISTELYLNDGQTLGIGGLIKQKLDDEVRKTIFLSDIPILGAMFKKKVSRTGGGFGEKGDTELFIILTPKIVSGKKETTINTSLPSSVEPKAVSAKQDVLPTDRVVSSQDISDEEKKKIMEKAVYSDKPITQILSQPKSADVVTVSAPKPQAKAEIIKEEKPALLPVVKQAPLSVKEEPNLKSKAVPDALSEAAEGVSAKEKKEAMEKVVYSDKPATQILSQPKSADVVTVSAPKPQAKAGIIKEEKPVILPVVKQAVTEPVKEIVPIVKEEKSIKPPVIKQDVSDSVKKETMKNISLAMASENVSEETGEIPDAQKKAIMEKKIYSDKPISQIFSEPKLTAQESFSAPNAAPADKKETPVIEQEVEIEETETAVDKEEKVETAGSVISNANPDSVVEYANNVRKAILEKLSYPSLAKQRGMQGRVKLKLHISSLGELLEVFIKESSTYEILDYNTLSVAKNIIKYPPFPSAITLDDLWLEIPIDYRLN